MSIDPPRMGLLFVRFFCHLPICLARHPFCHPSVHPLNPEHPPCWGSLLQDQAQGLGGPGMRRSVAALPLTPFPQRAKWTFWGLMEHRALSPLTFMIPPNRKCDQCPSTMVEGRFTPLEGHEECTDSSVVCTLRHLNLC